MIELGLSVAASLGCVWAIRQCVRFRRDIEKESQRVEWLKNALVKHQLAPNAHDSDAGDEPWEITRRPAKRKGAVQGESRFEAEKVSRNI